MTAYGSHASTPVCVLALATLMAACRPGSGQELSNEQMSSVVAREQPALEKCYQAGLDQTPYDHEFQIEAQLRIAPDGRVTEVELDQSGIASLGSCVKKAIRGWRFPQAEVETRAQLPLIFHPKVEHVTKPPPQLQLPPGFRVMPQQNRAPEPGQP